jgi:predicted AAA+ superfamily ATPase
MWIPRKIERLITKRAATRPVVVLTGARQTGKTSLVKRLFPNYELVTLDLPSEAALAEHDPAEFLSRHRPPIVVDEVQYAPGLFRHIKAKVDVERDMAGRFILTGSQRLPLMRSVSDSLAGRADIIELETLSWGEVKAARPDIEVEDYLVRGGFPELHEKPELDAQAFFRSYIATYLERDLRQLLQVGSLRDFERFIRACGLRSAQLLNRADLARDVGISGSTAAAWISVLDASGQIALLEPWFSNRAKSLVKTPKVYVRDSGLCAFLVGIRGAHDLSASPLSGALWETLVFGEIRRLQMNAGGGWRLNFWRDRNREADFLWHHGGRFELADAKWSEMPGAGDIAQLHRVAAELPKGTVDGLSIICRTRNAYPIPPDVRALPLHGMPERWAS